MPDRYECPQEQTIANMVSTTVSAQSASHPRAKGKHELVTLMELVAITYVLAVALRFFQVAFIRLLISAFSAVVNLRRFLPLPEPLAPRVEVRASARRAARSAERRSSKYVISRSITIVTESSAIVNKFV